MKKQIFLVSLCLLAVSSGVFAQSFGKIRGVVTDGESGDPLPGANIVVVGSSFGAASNVDGYYTILRVPPGIYEVRADFIGYQKVLIQNVEVLTDLTTQIDFQLKTQTVELGSEVVIVAERPIIRKDLTSAEARVQAEEISRLPVQELGDILNLQAGISRDSAGGIHIRGGRSTEVAYMVNGVRITDDFTRTQSFQVENESIQELQVISGTFNAEYGEALSGIVNIVTKAGGNDFHGSFEAWAGDYVSGRDDLFFNIDNIDAAANHNFSASLSGPIIKDKLTFFATGRRFKNGGYIYGANAFNANPFVVTDTSLTFAAPPDSGAFALNFKSRWSGQASLEWKITGPLKFKLDFLGSKEARGKYDHKNRLIPLAVRGDDERGFTVIGNLTHAVSANTFYELTGSYKESQLKSFLFDDPLDPRYVHPSFTRVLIADFFGLSPADLEAIEAAPDQFNLFGQDMARFERKTKSWIGKFDVTSQFSKRHQVKAGVEVKADDVFMDDFSLQFDESAPNGIGVLSIRTPEQAGRNILNRDPFTFAAYIQDKIEYESLIINAGLRYDRFDANGLVPVDLSDPNIFSPTRPLNIWRDTNSDGVIALTEQTVDNEKTVAERKAGGWYRDTSVKTQLSPRLGIAYPITDRGVIHFSFGIFTQIPDYEQLYREDRLKITTGTGLQGERFGNPDLKPQKTTMYELGLQQQLSENMGADVTFFYRDIRDWVGVSATIPAFTAGVAYTRRINRDFANVTGFTLALNRRFANSFSFNVDYTFQVAEGTNSNPDQEFFTQKDGGEPTKQLTPLDWDQQHALNSNLFVGGENWGASLIQRLNSGQPYTPSVSTAREGGASVIQGLEKNSRRKPLNFTLDFTAFKQFDFGNFRLKFFGRIFNLLDSSNPTSVFSDTGEADFTLAQLVSVSADKGFFVRPDFYSEPRRVQLGMNVGF